MVSKIAKDVDNFSAISSWHSNGISIGGGHGYGAWAGRICFGREKEKQDQQVQGKHAQSYG